MNCPICRRPTDDEAVFCTHCGGRLKKDLSTVSLKCSNCGGTLNGAADSDVLVCPYCGSKELIIDNEEAMAKVEIERIRSHERKALDERRQEHRTRFRKGALSKVLVVFFIISLIIACAMFASLHVVAGIFAAVMALCFVTAWMFGMQFFSEKTNAAHTLFTILGVAMLVPVIFTAALDDNYSQAATADWSVIMLADRLPDPPSHKCEINSNTEALLRVYIKGVSKEEFYDFLAECKDMGYTIEPTEYNLSYKAFNEEGYYLDIYYWSEHRELTLSLKAPAKLSQLDWYGLALSSVLPEPPVTTGTVVYDEYMNTTTVTLGRLSSAQFAAYRDACREKGFTIEEKDSVSTYEAFNPDGYKIMQVFTSGNGELAITVTEPLTFSEIIWPTSGVAALLPEPPSLSACVHSSDGWYYSVSIHGMTHAMYEEYVEQCKAAGFDRDSYKYDNGYTGYISLDEWVNITYKGFDTVNITVTGRYGKEY